MMFNNTKLYKSEKNGLLSFFDAAHFYSISLPGKYYSGSTGVANCNDKRDDLSPLTAKNSMQ